MIFFFKALKSPNNRKIIINSTKICPILIRIEKMCLFFERPIVQLVERAAHDGFVVGSNPARPIFRLR